MNLQIYITVTKSLNTSLVVVCKPESFKFRPKFVDCGLSNSLILRIISPVKQWYNYMYCIVQGHNLWRPALDDSSGLVPAPGIRSLGTVERHNPFLAWQMVTVEAEIAKKFSNGLTQLQAETEISFSSHILVVANCTLFSSPTDHTARAWWFCY